MAVKERRDLDAPDDDGRGFGPLPTVPCIHCGTHLARAHVLIKRPGRAMRRIRVWIEAAAGVDGSLVRIDHRVFAPATTARGPLDPLRYRPHARHCTG